MHVLVAGDHLKGDSAEPSRHSDANVAMVHILDPPSRRQDTKAIASEQLALPIVFPFRPTGNATDVLPSDARLMAQVGLETNQRLHIRRMTGGQPDIVVKILAGDDR